MHFKKQVYQPRKKINPFVGLLLFLISWVLLVLTGPLGFIYGIFYTLFKRGIKGWAEFLLEIAVSVDQLGNVLMQHLLNALWVTKGGYRFGNRDETISSALGRNKTLGTLTGFGKFIDRVLDAIDENHTLDSIDYFIEPTDQIIDKLAWIYLKDQQILSTRSKGKTVYYIPGGKREAGESDVQALTREIKEELSVDLVLNSLSHLGIFEARADGYPSGTLVRMNCYTALYNGTLQPASEIEEFTWLSYEDIDKVSAVDQLIFEFLKEKGLLV